VNSHRLVDTNLIVRHLTQDHEKHARAAAKVFDSCDRGEITLVLLPEVLAECVFVLESFYDQPRAAISTALGKLIASPGVQLVDSSIHLDALRRYGASKVHFVDCVIAATAAADGVAVATFDRDFRKFSDVRVEL
jgi:predicted nucleic acid-binding protein